MKDDLSFYFDPIQVNQPLKNLIENSLIVFLKGRGEM